MAKEMDEIGMITQAGTISVQTPGVQSEGRCMGIFIDTQEAAEGEVINIAGLLTRKHESASAYDLYAHEDSCIQSGQSRLVGTGIHVKQMPDGMYGYLTGLPEISAFHGLFYHPMIVDSGFQGEIRIALFNASEKACLLRKGTRIAQIVFSQCVHPKMVMPDVINGKRIRFMREPYLKLNNRISDKLEESEW